MWWNWKGYKVSIILTLIVPPSQISCGGNSQWNSWSIIKSKLPCIFYLQIKYFLLWFCVIDWLIDWLIYMWKNMICFFFRETCTSSCCVRNKRRSGGQRRSLSFNWVWRSKDLSSSGKEETGKREAGNSEENPQSSGKDSPGGNKGLWNGKRCCRILWNIYGSKSIAFSVVKSGNNCRRLTHTGERDGNKSPGFV